jgi:hypothetical protein
LDMDEFKVGDKVIGYKDNIAYYTGVVTSLSQLEGERYIKISLTFIKDDPKISRTNWVCYYNPDTKCWGSNCKDGRLVHAFKQDKIIELKKEMIGQ